ncbi:PKD domain-containing protein [Fulvivirga sp. M361]|nr:PKD domain-containing protein [Fulvivirga sp. M361]
MISIFILAIALLGCSDDDDDDKLPQVVAGFTQTLNDDTGTVTFINVSTNATNYVWDFGDDETSTEINPIKTYATGTYKVTLTASNDAGVSAIFEDSITVLIKRIISLPATFDDTSVNYDAETFDGTAFEIIDNPDVSGTNDKNSKVGAITNSGAEFEGVAFDLGTEIDLATDKRITMNFWADSTVAVLLKLEEGTAGDIETSANHGGTGWETLAFDFNASGKYSRLTLFVDGPGTRAGTFYIDDIMQAETPPAPCTEETAQSLSAADFNLTFQSDPSASIISDNAGFEWVTNPDSENDVNSSCNVAKISRTSASAFANNQINLDAKLDFDTNSGFKIKVYSGVADFRVLIKLEEQANSDNFTELEVTATKTNEWEELTFPFASSESNQYDKIILFFDLNTMNEAIYYFDDLMLYGTGGGGGGGTPATFPLDFEDGLNFFNAFEGATVAVINNPQPAGNSSAKVLELGKPSGAPFFAGINSDPALNGPSINLANGLTFTVKIWSPKAGINVRMRLEQEPGVLDPPAFEIFQPLANANQWETLTFDFSTTAATSGASYTRLVLNTDWDTDPAGGETYYIDDIVQTTGSGGGGGTGCTDTMLELPIDFDCESTTYDLSVFNGASYRVIDNPELSGINNVASKVGEIVNTGAAFEGGSFTLDNALDLTTDKAVTMKVYSTVGLPVLLKLEGGTGPNIELPVNHTGSGWEQLTFEFTSSDAFTVVTLFIDGPGTTAGTFYVDDIEQVAASGGGGGGGSLATFPLDFEDGVTIFNPFEGATAAVIDNPQPTGNSSSKVLELGKPSGVRFFAGINSDQTLNGPSIDLGNGLIFKVKIWSPKAGINVRMRLELEPGDIDPPAFEIFQTLTPANEWVTLTFDFSTTPASSSAVYTRLVLNTDWDTDPAGGETYYIDDITQE